MSHFPKFYDAIDDIAEHLRTDFIGPVDDNEVLEMEEPLSRYSLGILWAQIAKNLRTSAYSSPQLWEYPLLHFQAMN